MQAQLNRYITNSWSIIYQVSSTVVVLENGLHMLKQNFFSILESPLLVANIIPQSQPILKYFTFNINVHRAK